MSEKKITRREREKKRQRQEMLETALDLFSDKGYHNVSMHEIAHNAEFAIGTVYKFFGNKEELYKALIVDLADRFHDALTSAIESTEGEVEKLRSYVRTIGAVFMDNASVIRLYFAETQGASFNIEAGLDNEIRQRHQKVLCSVASIFESGMCKKIFFNIAQPYHLALALESICHAFLFYWLEEGDQKPYPEDPDVILNIFFKGLLAN
jgi:AcrR family transcriptional regulator